MKRLRRLLACACAATLTLLGTQIAPSRAAISSTHYGMTDMHAPDVELDAWFGDGLANAGDLNGDGVTDMFTAETNLDVGGLVDVGRVYAVNGRDRTILYKIDSPEPQAGALFGSFFTAFGDANGDGKRDVAVGTSSQNVYTGSGTPCGAPEPNGCNEKQGKGWVFSGANGSLLYALNDPVPQGSATDPGRFASRMGNAGDVTGDGVGDIFVNADAHDQPAGCGETSPLPNPCRVDEGQAFIFNGVNGALVRTLNYPVEDRPNVQCTANCGNFGRAVQSPGDTNGDGVPDQLVDASSFSLYSGTGTACGTPEPNGCFDRVGRMYVFSGKDGSLLLKIDNPFPTDGVFFGFQDVAPRTPGDVNGDGAADIFGAASEEGANHGQGYVFNGKTGALLYELKKPNAEKGDMFFSADTTDYNKDGVPDIYAGDLPVNTLPQDENGGTYIFDGRNGNLLKSIILPVNEREPGRRTTTPPNAGPFIGWSVLAPGDLNGDGEPDYVSSTPRRDEPGTLNVGRLWFTLSHPTSGYRLVASDGGVFAFGNAGFFGSTGAVTLNQPIVAATSTPSNNGYWLTASDGGVFAFGDAGFFGSTGATTLDKPIVATASPPTGDGYWMAASDGGVFAFGDAKFLGSTGGTPLNKSVVAIANRPAGAGYWLVASDGGVFAFGQAGFFGSTGALPLKKPIVGMAPSATGNGYWLVASDGGVFAFGDAGFFGSAGNLTLNKPIVSIASSPTGRGYWLTASDGGVFSFGDAGFFGSTGAIRLAKPIVGMGT